MDMWIEELWEKFGECCSDDYRFTVYDMAGMEPAVWHRFAVYVLQMAAHLADPTSAIYYHVQTMSGEFVESEAWVGAGIISKRDARAGHEVVSRIVDEFYLPFPGSDVVEVLDMLVRHEAGGNPAVERALWNSIAAALAVMMVL